MAGPEAWERHWRSPGVVDYGDQDPLSVAIFEALVDILGTVRGRRICEAGSGSGKISLWLAQAGAKVCLVDFTAAALDLSRRAFAERGLAGEFVQRDVRDLPVPEVLFDLTWNAGVLEHLEPADQASILCAMARVTRPGGWLATATPHARCIPYQLGKYWAVRAGRWPYGEERPLFSHREAYSLAGIELERELSLAAEVGFDFFRFIPLAGPPLREIALAWWAGLSTVERRELPGYLLLGMARR